MRFAHIADCHIGSFREPKLRDISTKAFEKAIDISIEKKADFILISGDLFNTSLPGIDFLKSAVVKLKDLKDNGIPAYIIAGSHDFSANGKTMLDVLESAGLVKNVVRGDAESGKLRLKFTVDKKTGAKITGMLGKKGMLEKSYYEDLDREHLEKEPGFKIFMLHTALTELKSKELEKMDSAPVSMLPKGFDYYAAGHVHEVIEKDMTKEGYGRIVYPGPLFPNSFSEIEKLGCGGFYFYDDGKLGYEQVIIQNTFSKRFDCSNRTVEEVESEIYRMIKDNEFIGIIVTLRFSGKLRSGKITEIDFRKVFDALYSKGAYFVMKNTAGVLVQGFEEIKVHEENIDMLEERLIDEHIGNLKQKGFDCKKEREIVVGLLRALDQEKNEGERAAEFERRIKQSSSGFFGLGDETDL